MKHLFLIAIMSLSSVAFAADWKVVAETTSCDDKIQIMGKEGEKYVMAVRGDEKTKLFAKDGSAFHEETMRSTEFTSAKSASDVSYTFIQPSMVEANPPKIDVAYNGAKKRCKMELNK
jgi:hypothetical protein